MSDIDTAFFTRDLLSVGDAKNQWNDQRQQEDDADKRHGRRRHEGVDFMHGYLEWNELFDTFRRRRAALNSLRRCRSLF